MSHHWTHRENRTRAFYYTLVICFVVMCIAWSKPLVTLLLWNKRSNIPTGTTMSNVPLKNMPCVPLGIVPGQNYTFVCPNIFPPVLHWVSADYRLCDIGEPR